MNFITYKEWKKTKHKRVSLNNGFKVFEVISITDSRLKIGDKRTLNRVRGVIIRPIFWNKTEKLLGRTLKFEIEESDWSMIIDLSRKIKDIGLKEGEYLAVKTNGYSHSFCFMSLQQYLFYQDIFYLWDYGTLSKIPVHWTNKKTIPIQDNELFWKWYESSLQEEVN